MYNWLQQHNEQAIRDFDGQGEPDDEERGDELTLPDWEPWEDEIYEPVEHWPVCEMCGEFDPTVQDRQHLGTLVEMCDTCWYGGGDWTCMWVEIDS